MYDKKESQDDARFLSEPGPSRRSGRRDASAARTNIWLIQRLAACTAALLTPIAYGADELSAQDDAAIVVTAERLPRSPLKLPLSVTAFSTRELEIAQVGSIMELQKLVPGLTVTEDATGHGQAYIRGIGTDIVGAGVEGAVAVYVDGIYQSRAIGETMRFLDVERVEVLKGPQGVLYGRNATGGAINIVSKAPSRYPTGEADVQAGSYGERVVRGTVSGPLSERAAYGRLSAQFRQDDGDSRNLLLDARTNNHDLRSLRGALELTPSDTFGVTFAATYYRDDFSPVLKPLAPEVNPLFTVFGATVIDDPRSVLQNQVGAVGLTHSGVDATARWDFETARLASVTAWRKTDYAARQADLDGTEIPLMNVGGAGVLETARFFSQEFTLASDAPGPLSWVGLASWTHQKVDQPAFNLALPLLGLEQNSVATVATDALAVGGQATWALTERVHVTGGARWSRETKDLISLQTFANNTPTGSMSDKRTWSAVTPKAVIDYAPDKHSLVYASATKGFKSGGFNTTTIQPGFEPETAISYEAGIKGKWADGRVQASLAAFRTRYKDMQISVVTSAGGLLGSTIQNAARAESRGVEASVALKPTPNLDVCAGLQLLRARIVEFVSIDTRNPAAGPLSQAGNPLARAPDVTVSLAVQYAWPVQNGGGRLVLRGEDAYRSKIYYTPFRNDYASSPAVSVINAMLSYESLRSSGWYGAAFVKNLTDRTYTSNVFDPQSLGYLAYYVPGRTVGVQAGYRF